MTRNILTILIAVFSITTIYAQETDVEKEGFKGKVKIVTQVNYDYVDNSKGEEYERYIIKYDSDGNTIEKNGHTDRRGTINQEHTYKYDSDGNKIDEIQYSKGKLKKTCKYDSYGNMIEESRYNSDGSLDYKWTFKYDEDGNKVEWIIYNSAGSLTDKYTYKYDAHKNKISEVWILDDGTIINNWTREYTYDSKGNWIKIIIFVSKLPIKIDEREITYFQ